MTATPISSPPRNRRSEFERAGAHLAFGVLPAGVMLLLVVAVFVGHIVAYDFYWSYFPAAYRLLHGGDPYAITHREIVGGTAFVYPALSAVVFVPFALLGRGLSSHVYMLLCLLLVPGTLWAAGVRDWRMYGATLLWRPIVVGWAGGNVSVPLALMVAFTWRYRDRPVVAGVLTAAAVSLKPFVWPLGLWLLVTRRWRAAGWALAWGLVINLLAWWIVGFSEIHVYLKLSGEVTDALWRGGYSMLAVAHHLGFGRGVGEVLLLVVSVLVGLGVVCVGFVRRDERAALVLAVLLMLVASPLVWVHYFALLLIPLALTRPRSSAVWAVPILMWACPTSTTVVGWQAAVAWAVTAVCLVASLRTGQVGGGQRAATITPDPGPKLGATSWRNGSAQMAAGTRMLD